MSKRNYAQISKEALAAIVRGILELYVYLHSQYFELMTGHESFAGNFYPCSCISIAPTTEEQWYAAFLSGCNCEIYYKMLRKNENASIILRIPLARSLEGKSCEVKHCHVCTNDPVGSNFSSNHTVQITLTYVGFHHGKGNTLHFKANETLLEAHCGNHVREDIINERNILCNKFCACVGVYSVLP